MSSKKEKSERTQKQWKLYLQELIDNSDKAAIEALLRIYNNQTASEKEKGVSIHLNDVGFNQADSSYLSHLARVELRSRKLGLERGLTLYEINHVKFRIKKYWKQLMILAKEKEAKKNMIPNLNNSYGGKLTQEEMQEVQEYLQTIDEKTKEAELVVTDEYRIHDETSGAKWQHASSTTGGNDQW